MDGIVVSLLVAACVFAGAFAGMQLSRLLPTRHMTTQTRDAVRLAIGMLSIVAALVLGLLTASAKRTFDDAEQNISSYATDIVLLNQTLVHFDAAAAPIRKSLLQYTENAVRTTWPDSAPAQKLPLEDKAAGELLRGIAYRILALPALTDDQRWVRTQALEISARLLHTRGLLLMKQHGTISPVLLVVLTAWITVIFAGYGLHAPRNAAVIVAFLVCSLSIGAAIFLILDMDGPFDGIVMASGDAMKSALAHLQAQ
jgi:hypothetical protein